MVLQAHSPQSKTRAVTDHNRADFAGTGSSDKYDEDEDGDDAEIDSEGNDDDQDDKLKEEQCRGLAETDSAVKAQYQVAAKHNHEDP